MSVDLAVVMITLNEAHNLPGALDNVDGWAREVIIVDSYSQDETIDLALDRGATVVQRRFNGFGDQWNFAVNELPISSAWTLKLDPDERLTPELKLEIQKAVEERQFEGISFDRQLYFMGVGIGVKQEVFRAWPTGTARFTEVEVNERPVITGRVMKLNGLMEHHDSPHLHHWYDKQNFYSTAEARQLYELSGEEGKSALFGSGPERRRWLKRHIYKIPFRFTLIFLYNYLLKGAWRAGKVGYIWARLRSDVYRMREYKYFEMRNRTGSYAVSRRQGRADPRLSGFHSGEIGS